MSSRRKRRSIHLSKASGYKREVECVVRSNNIARYDGAPFKHHLPFPGRTWQFLKNYPTIKGVLGTLSSFLKALPIGADPLYIVAHNGRAYDFPILKRELEELSMQDLGVRNIRFVDSMDVFRSYANTVEGANWPSYGLDAVSQR